LVSITVSSGAVLLFDGVAALLRLEQPDAKADVVIGNTDFQRPVILKSA